jgi:hypothetical protein
MSTVVNAVTLVREHIEGEHGAFICLLASFILWGLALLASTLLGRKIVPARGGGGIFNRRTTAASTPTGIATEEPGVRRSSFDLERAAHRFIFGQFFAISVSEDLYGVSRWAKILTWLAFTVGALYLLLRSVLHRSGKLSDMVTRAVDFVFMLALLILWTAIVSIAFDKRW